MELDDRLEHILLGILRDTRLDSHSFGYWRSVMGGVRELMNIRDTVNDKRRMMKSFENAKRKIISSPLNHIQEDALDEIEAILINWYPMNDFWTVSYEEFIDHPAFRRWI